MKGLRRKDKQITDEEARELLTTAEYGVLSTVSPEGMPYGVPLNYVYLDDAIYFHCARTGHKLDNLKDNPDVSFCVVGDTEVLPSEFSTNYESVIVFGRASEVEGAEWYVGLMGLLKKYSPDFLEEGKQYIEKLKNATTVIKIDVQHISGKKAPPKSK